MELAGVPSSSNTKSQISDSSNSEATLNSNNDILNRNDCQETNWQLVFATGGVCFLAAVEGAAAGMSEWPYMTTIDPSATSQFHGMISSVFTAGHAIFAVAFSMIYYKYHSVRLPLILGRIFAFIGCVAYLCVEMLPNNRRYLMLCCYFIFGIATSSTAVLRMYIIEISTKADRARAFAVIIVAQLLSVIIGPVIQLCFAGISYPGAEIVYKIRFHIFSAPIWIAAFLNIISIVVIAAVMKPVKRKTDQLSTGTSIFCWNITYIREKLNEVRESNACWSLILLCVIQKFMHIPTNSAVVIVGPFLMMAFDWGREESLIYSAIAMSVVGIISIAVAALMMIPTVGRIPPRWIYLMSLFLPLVMYLISYPYEATSHPIPSFNETTGTGCNSAEYSWCEGALATSQYVFVPLFVVVISLILPLGAISLDTVYSKLFGNMDQTVMQGAMVVVGDIVGILGPIYATVVFTHWGQGTLWIIDFLLTVFASTLWIVGFPKLKKYE